MTRETVGIVDSKKIRLWEIPKVEPDIIRGFEELGDVAGVVARALDQFGIHGTIPAVSLPPVSPGSRVIGSAITVRSIPEREVPYRYWLRGEMTRLGEREAFFLASEGDVIVIDGSSVYPASNLGSMSVALAARLGVSGVVVDGTVTGVDGIRTAPIPVWARGGTTVTGHHRLETAEINGPIGICGVRVDPGDLIVADDSGITVVPRQIAGEVLALCVKMRGFGSKIRNMIEQGDDRDAIRQELGSQMKTLSESQLKS
jgi:regulator of RNase E activity RraA